ncbi:MAG: trypsin-like peptidase domain-containing protein [Thermoleophilia bacterium]
MSSLPPLSPAPEPTPPAPRRRGGLMRTAAVGLAAGLAGGVLVVGGDRVLGGDDGTRAPTAVTTTRVVTTTAPAADDGQQVAQTTDWAATAARVSPGVVAITATSQVQDGPLGPQQQTAGGSGFVIDEQGHIVTNQHVVDGATAISVDFADGTTAKATLVGSDATTDLAVIKVDVAASRLHPLALRTGVTPRVGEAVLAIGNPFGYAGSVTQGIVSGLGREIESPNGFTLTDAIQTDAAINHGNSGGPLVDRQGRVIGVNAQIADSGVNANVGVAFAIPIDAGTARVIDQLTTAGRVSHAWLGISGGTVDDRIAAAGDLKADHGVLVVGLAQDGPAQRAGLRGGSRAVSSEGSDYCVGGDIITAIDGAPVDSMSALQDTLESTGPGRTVSIRVVRADGSSADLKATLSAQPSTAPRVTAAC